MIIIHRPVGVSLIGYFYIFGSVVLIISLFFQTTADEITIATRLGFPWIPEVIMKIALSAFSIVLAYYYLKLSVLGFWLMIVYCSYFLSVSLYLSTEYGGQPFIGNIVFSVIVLIYTIFKRSNFI